MNAAMRIGIGETAVGGKNETGSRQARRGGEGGIRTLDELSTHTHFPGALLKPLGHLSDPRILAGRGRLLAAHPATGGTRRSRAVRQGRWARRALAPHPAECSGLSNGRNASAWGAKGSSPCIPSRRLPRPPCTATGASPPRWPRAWLNGASLAIVAAPPLSWRGA